MLTLARQPGRQRRELLLLFDAHGPRLKARSHADKDADGPRLQRIRIGRPALMPSGGWLGAGQVAPQDVCGGVQGVGVLVGGVDQDGARAGQPARALGAPAGSWVVAGAV